MTAVFLTIDTELAWRHHQAGRDPGEMYRRSIEPAGVGLSYQLATLAGHGLKACFFVDPMPALTYGLGAVRRMVEPILEAGQEVQLRLHPRWTAARPGDGGSATVRFELNDYSAEEQLALIGGAAELPAAAGAPRPVAFRAGRRSAGAVAEPGGRAARAGEAAQAVAAGGAALVELGAGARRLRAGLRCRVDGQTGRVG